jgi:hypothetical protein
MTWYDRHCTTLAFVAALAAGPLVVICLAAKPLIRAWLGVDVELGVTP